MGPVTKSGSRGVDGEVIGGDAGLEGGVDEDLALRIDFEDGAAAVADEEVAFGVEGGSGGHAHAFSVGGELAGGVDAVDGALGARGDEEVALGIKGQAGGVEDAGDKGRAAAVGADADDGDWSLFAAWAGDGGVDHSGTADGGTGDGMQPVSQLAGDAQGHGVADAGGGADFNQAGGGFCRNPEGEARGAAHGNMGRLAIDQHSRRTEGVGAEMPPMQLDFAEGQGRGGHMSSMRGSGGASGRIGRSCGAS